MARFIELVKPVMGFLPEVEKPAQKQKLSLTEKVFWTAMALLVYLLASSIPLYGIKTGGSGEAFYMLRSMLASNSRTLMELGIAPIITSGTIMQLLQGAKIIDVGNNAEDQKLMAAASKLLGVLITIGQALAYVLSGMYGPLSQLGTFTACMLVGQLFLSGIMVLLLDDLLAKGWGLGGGINLFIVTNICEQIVWGALSPTTFNMGGATQIEGALVGAVHLLFTEKSFPRGLYKAFFRSEGYNLMNLLATAAVVLLVSYVHGMKVSMPMRFKNARGAPAQQYSVKLFYTSNMPIILLTALVSNVYFFSQVLYRKFPTNIIAKLLGVWQDSPSGRSMPVWGLSYILAPPRQLSDLVDAPFRSLFYVVFMLTVCAMFAKVWVEISGSGPSDVVRQLNESRVDLEYNMLRKKLHRYIPTAAAFGGMCVAALSIFADLLGAIGSGTGILMAVGIITDMYDKFDKERRAGAAGGPGGADGRME